MTSVGIYEGHDYMHNRYDERRRTQNRPSLCPHFKYEWSEIKSSALVYYLTNTQASNNKLVEFMNQLVTRFATNFPLHSSITPDALINDYARQQLPNELGPYPVGQMHLFRNNAAAIKQNFYALYNYEKYLWTVLTDRRYRQGEIFYNLINILQQNGTFKFCQNIRGERDDEPESSDPVDTNRQIRNTRMIGINPIDGPSSTLRKLQQTIPKDVVDNPTIEAWVHPGRRCRTPYWGKIGELMKGYNNQSGGPGYYASIQCGFSCSTNFLFYGYLGSISQTGPIGDPGNSSYTPNDQAIVDLYKLVLSTILGLVGDGGHNIKEVVYGITSIVILLHTFLEAFKNGLNLIANTIHKNGGERLLGPVGRGFAGYADYIKQALQNRDLANLTIKLLNEREYMLDVRIVNIFLYRAGAVNPQDNRYLYNNFDKLVEIYSTGI